MRCYDWVYPGRTSHAYEAQVERASPDAFALTGRRKKFIIGKQNRDVQSKAEGRGETMPEEGEILEENLDDLSGGKSENKYELRGLIMMVYYMLTIAIVFVTAIFAWYINVRIDWRKGTAISATLFLEGIIYSLTYTFFARLYESHRIDLKRFAELLFSQLLSFALADICLYAAGFVWFHNFSEIYVSRFLLVYLIQVAASGGVTFLFCKLYRRYTMPKNVLILYGNRKEHLPGQNMPEPNPGEESRQAVAASYKDFEKILKQRRWRPYYRVHSCLPDTTDLKKIIQVIGMCDELYLFQVQQEMIDSLTVYGTISHRRMFITPKVSDILTMRGEISVTFGIPFVEAHGFTTAWYYPGVKRAFDLVCAVLVLVLFFPAFLLIGAVNQIQMKEGFLSRQVCLTYGGFIFDLYQFAGLIGNTSRFALAAKRLRLDRLPEFLSVLRGGMSIVGPAPVEKGLAWQYIETIPDYRIRHNAKAGITGYAQVWCAEGATIADRLKMDQVYCSQMSIYTDLRIIFYTIKRWAQKVQKGN